MDINSYSYTPHILDEETLLENVNDDTCISLRKDRRYSLIFYTITAYSYDGQMDIYEEYRDRKQATNRYNYIVDNYADSVPPEEEAESYITID